jgi:allophanate hydrolase
VPKTLDFRGDARAEAAFWSTLEKIAGVPGVTLVDVDVGVFAETAALLYEGPWVAERRAALGDFFTAHGDALEPSVHQVIAKGDDLTACDAFRGAHRLQDCRRKAETVFESIDLLLVPTTPTHYTCDEIAESPIARNGDLGLYTNFVNLLGLSALALPGLFRADGLPAGITLIAPGGGDHRLAEFARTLEPLIHRRLGLGPKAPPRQSAPLAPLPFFEPVARVAVVGAHLAGQPLNWQLLERGGRLLRSARTAPKYRLYALPGTAPPKPGLVRTEGEGGSIEIEVWELPLRAYGGFVAEIPTPLAIGTLELEDGDQVQGFLCESWAVAGARDITAYGGWRSYLAHGVSPTS